MSKGKSPGSGPVADGIEVHLRGFLAALGTAGYAETTLRTKRWLMGRFVRWARGAKLVVADLDEACVRRFLTRPSRRRRKPRKMERATLYQFLEYLRAVGFVPPLSASQPSSAEVLVQSYLQHLRNDRGLCGRSLQVYAPFARAFVAARGLPERVASLDASAVRGYVLDQSRNRSSSVVKLLTVAVRSFLRFLFLDGRTARDFSTAVPPVRKWRLAAAPPFLTPEEVEQVIAVIDRSTASGCRAFAIVLLLARLGLRAGEVATLELDDLRWDMGEIVVRGKGRVHDRLPLLDDVGEALAHYLRQARGPSASRRVFLRRSAPHVGLSGPTAVCLVARAAVRRAGLRLTGRVGAHIFRHSLATRMIRRGASLEDISRVLRHRSTDTTQLYAKVEFEALRGVSLPWPTPEAHR